MVGQELVLGLRAADRVIFMDGGAVAHEAAPEDFFTGAVPDRVARFLGRFEG